METNEKQQMAGELANALASKLEDMEDWAEEWELVDFVWSGSNSVTLTAASGEVLTVTLTVA